MRITRFERTQDIEEGHGSERWLIGFTDLTTLLLAFFILLFSATQVKNNAWLEASTSMRSSFRGEKQITEVTGLKGSADASKNLESANPDPGLNVHYLDALIKKRFAGDPLLQGLQTHLSYDSVLISLPSQVTFHPGDDRLTPDGMAVIRHLSGFLSRLPNAIDVIGHADSSVVNEGKNFGSNWHLSLARAYTVAASLEKSGIRQEIGVLGRGSADASLVSTGLPPDQARQRARRVDVRIYAAAP